jgi:superoxide dismutase, Cu-Zn family
MIKPAAITVTLLCVPVVSLVACSPNQHPSTQPGSTPPAHSGSAAPSRTNQVSPSSSAPGADTLTAQLKTADGRSVATATFDFTTGYATVTVKTSTTSILEPGFHMMHVHQIGKCEPNSVAPTGGPSGDFLSAGPHYQAPGHTGEPASGDLPSLQARKDGAALMVTTTDGFTKDDLLAGNKTAIVLHAADTSPNMEKRIACGVIGTG